MSNRSCNHCICYTIARWQSRRSSITTVLAAAAAITSVNGRCCTVCSQLAVRGSRHRRPNGSAAASRRVTTGRRSCRRSGRHAMARKAPSSASTPAGNTASISRYSRNWRKPTPTTSTASRTTCRIMPALRTSDGWLANYRNGHTPGDSDGAMANPQRNNGQRQSSENVTSCLIGN